MKKVYSLWGLLTVGILSLPSQIQAQEFRAINPITCFFHEFSEMGTVPVSAQVALGTSLELVDFIFNYEEEVPANVRAVVDYAGVIWASKLVSTVPIRVDVSWEAVEEDMVLASAGPSTIYRDFPGAIDRRIWYPVPLAEAISESNLNGNEADINVTINSEANWYYQLDGKTPANRIDMLSVIIHELGHGLGFFSSADVQGDTVGVIGFEDLPMIFDTYLVNAERRKLTNEERFPNPSRALLDEFTSREIAFASELAAQFYGPFPPLYAPASFKLGSSISHLDERAFPPGSQDALMSPFIAFGESVHDLGNVTLAIMTELGWNAQFNVTPTNEPLPNLSFRLYPNPATDYLRIDLPETALGQPAELQILDLSGKLILRTVLARDPSAQKMIPLGDLANGTYLVRLLAGPKNRGAQTLVVQH